MLSKVNLILLFALLIFNVLGTVANLLGTQIVICEAVKSNRSLLVAFDIPLLRSVGLKLVKMEVNQENAGKIRGP